MITSVFVGTIAIGGTAAAAPSDTSVGFGKDVLSGFDAGNPTSLDFGPDGRLYVSTQSGTLYALTVERNGPNDYAVTGKATITAIKDIPNHDDDGSYDSGETNRQVTGLTAAGTAENPVLYVTSSDPRIGGGGSGADTNLDTNSGVISKLTLQDDGSWDHVMLVRGLPRSEENHATNGLQYDASSNTLYVAQGGNTNKGAPSNNFAYTPSYALSGAILTVNLDAIDGMSAKDAANTDVPYRYDIPTLQNTNTPFGGDDGKNMGKLVEGGPVQVYSPGYRNPYDVTLTQDGQLYTVDNGPNGGWGGPPTGGSGACTNEPNEDNSYSTGDQIQYVTEGAYGGHGNPTRGNPDGAGLYDSNGNNIGSVAGAVYDGYDGAEQCNYEDPTQDNSLDYGGFEAFGASTNGLDEYTASNFGGAMAGDLLTSSFDGNIYRVQLNSGGDGLSAKPNALLSSSGTLDVVAQGDNGEFSGTVWSANHGGNSVTVFEPNDYGNSGGGASCDLSDSSGDADGDGYTNGDEQAAGTDPCSAGSTPNDNDNDNVSDTTDNDDDNDGLADTADPFAVDAENGLSTTLPVNYNFSRNSQSNSLEGIGFTGLMTNGQDYQDLYVPGDAVFGGANPALTQEIVKSGDAHTDQNDQQHAYQFGINPPNEPFVVHAPVTGYPDSPTNYQSAGIQLGTGDQDNYLKLVVQANDGNGGVEFAKEVGGSFDDIAQPSDASVKGQGTLTDLYMTVYPSNDTVVASYAVDGGARKAAGKTTIPAGWLSNQVDGQDTGLAVGVIATSFQSSEFPVTWNDFDVTPLNAGDGNHPPAANAGANQTVDGNTQVSLDGSGSSDPDGDKLGYSWVQTGGPDVQLSAQDAPNPSFTAPNVDGDTTLNFELTVSDGQKSDTDTTKVTIGNGGGGSGGTTSADVTVNGGSGNIDASTYNAGTLSITNTGDTAITSATIDLSQSTLPDTVFDPDGTAGDAVAKDFTVDSGVGGETTGSFASPHNGQNGQDGYDVLNIDFTDFQPGETLKFSTDIDPTSIKDAGGSGGAGSVSGLELSGSAVTVSSTDTTVENDLFTDGSKGGSQAAVTGSSTDAPTLGVQGVSLESTDFPAHSGGTVANQQQTVEVSGPAGGTVEVLHIVGSPAQTDGYDIDAYEADSATAVTTQTVQLDSNGDGTAQVSLTDTGLDYFIAAVDDGGTTGRTSETVVLNYDEDATTPKQNTLKIVGSPGGHTSYNFGVSGAIDEGASSGLGSADSISEDGASATGAVSYGTDTYVFTGSLEDISVSGSATVYLNGKEITPTRRNVLRIAGSPGGHTSYNFGVSGAIDEGASSGLGSADSIAEDGSSATGAVSYGTDTYVFTGSLEDISVSGSATVYLNGEKITPTTRRNVLKIVGSPGGHTSYNFGVSGAIDEAASSGLGSADSISEDGSSATGAVSHGTDTYVFTGDIGDISVSGDATVYLNGEELDLKTPKQNALRVVG